MAVEQVAPGETQPARPRSRSRSVSMIQRTRLRV
jgi:hypothetical protein